uniref:F-box domain-containing protein n=1 Tax=Glossina brevipalpis TaxID=37001 RepID=A0A1A9WTA4_9MUSC
MHLFDMPKEIFMEILDRLNYEEISKTRLVCRRFDQQCQQVLNRGFNKAVKQHSLSFKRIKALLPRRESERRNHNLARHADILTSVETRLSMLSMTYGKYMDLSLCCFIPGRVLDEIFRILRLIATTNEPLRPHEVLQELRDISSMAIEHFDEKIVNTLKKSMVDSNGRSYASSSTSSSSCAFHNVASTSGLGSISFNAMGEELSSVFRPYNYGTPGYIDNKRQAMHVKVLKSNCVKEPHQHKYTGSQQISYGRCSEAKAAMHYFRKLEVEYKKGIVQMHRMQQLQNLQSKRLQQALNAIAEYKTEMVELKKRFEEVDAKNREISANMKHINPASGDKKPSSPQSSSAVATIMAKDDLIVEQPTSTKNLMLNASNLITSKRHYDLEKKGNAEDDNAMVGDSSNLPKKPKI